MIQGRLYKIDSGIYLYKTDRLGGKVIQYVERNSLVLYVESTGDGRNQKIIVGENIGWISLEDYLFHEASA